jgi:thiamine biosynthesis protein ThiS
MNIILNNRPETIEGFQTATVQQLLEYKNFSYKMLVVRVNNATIKREEYDSQIIKDGDKVAVIHLMTGG